MYVESFHRLIKYIYMRGRSNRRVDKLLHILKKCGHGRVVCMDDTHGTNSCDFSLTTLLVVDEFGEGYPTAWCLSNRTDFHATVNLYMLFETALVVTKSQTG